MDQEVAGVQTSRPAPVRKEKGSRPSAFMREWKHSVRAMNKLLVSHELANNPFQTRDPGSREEDDAACEATKQRQIDMQAHREARDLPHKTDINQISAAAMHNFYLLLKHRKKGDDSEISVTSLKEIQDEIQRRESTQAADTIELCALDEGLTAEEAREAKYRENNEMIKERLPAKWKEFEGLFSARASDDLAERRPTVDHEIKLIGDNTLTTEPLRRMPDEYLVEAKRYITENLHKGFIALSNAPWAALILMAKKAGGGLRFCVDFRKLNELT
ncbi:uncharacterized protein RAG0_02879 [Rhynchosporium agropyri]|uniref:Reverse transcriptase domain-containing protein n=1 Tax=Rhynchosporium agropyri TaxID=914238 RepID=A0A1E1K2R7_9HELO|nr:uncharacterized protein RAG0_02879 [Rhynchosporium agropyri]